MSFNLNRSARSFQPEVSSSEKAQLKKFSNQLEDYAEITGLKKEIMEEKRAKEARQISQPALLPRAAPQNTHMLRSFQPPVILPSTSTLPSDEQPLDPNFVKRKPQLSFSQLMTLPLPKSAYASSQLRLEEQIMSQSPFVSSQARPIRRVLRLIEIARPTLFPDATISFVIIFLAFAHALARAGCALLPARRLR